MSSEHEIKLLMKHNLTDRLLLLLADYIDVADNFMGWKSFIRICYTHHFRRENWRWMKGYIEDKKKRQKIHSTLAGLKRRGYLQKEIFKNSECFILTPKANIKILRLKAKKLKKRILPNGQQLLVFFDIPEKLKNVREGLRATLRDLGFEQLQKSVWITNYDTMKEVNECIKNYRIEQYIQILTVKPFKRNNLNHF